MVKLQHKHHVGKRSPSHQFQLGHTERWPNISNREGSKELANMCSIAIAFVSYL